MHQILVGWLGLAVLAAGCAAAAATDVIRERVHDGTGRRHGTVHALRAMTVLTAVLVVGGLILTVLRLAAFA